MASLARSRRSDSDIEVVQEAFARAVSGSQAKRLVKSELSPDEETEPVLLLAVSRDLELIAEGADLQRLECLSPPSAAADGSPGTTEDNFADLPLAPGDLPPAGLETVQEESSAEAHRTDRLSCSGADAGEVVGGAEHRCAHAESLASKIAFEVVKAGITGALDGDAFRDNSWIDLSWLATNATCTFANSAATALLNA